MSHGFRVVGLLSEWGGGGEGIYFKKEEKGKLGMKKREMKERK